MMEKEFIPLTFYKVAYFRYEISKDGEIRQSSDHKIIRPFVQYEKPFVRLLSDDFKHTLQFRLDRLVALMFLPLEPRPFCIIKDKLWLYHKDGDYTNLDLDTMEWRLPGNMPIDEGHQKFEFIRTHRNLPPQKMSELYYETYHETMSPAFVSRVFTNKDRNIEIFHYLYQEFTPLFYQSRLSAGYVSEICKVIRDYLMDERFNRGWISYQTTDVRSDSMYKYIRLHFPAIRGWQIRDILEKKKYADISDEYFTLDVWGNMYIRR